MYIKLLFLIQVAPVIMLSLTRGFASSGSEVSSAELQQVQHLSQQIRDFETKFHQSEMLDSCAYINAISTMEQLITTSLALDSQFADSHFVNQAFIYLEKMKNLKLTALYQDGNCANTARTKFLHFPQTLNDVSWLQKYFLTDYEAILDYWIYNNRIYVCIVQKDSLKWVQWQAPVEHIKDQSSRLYRQLSARQDLLQLEFDYRLAHELYQYLFRPLEKSIPQVKTIFIIPDGFLIGFPFECLVVDTTTNHDQNKNINYSGYSKLGYLINRYVISYNYSTWGFLSPKNLPSGDRKLGLKLLLFSEPIISADIADHFYQLSGLLFHELELSYYSHDEIRRVSRLLWRHDIIKKDQATKQYFLEKGGSYRWLYLALPGLLNNVQPLKSGLLFTRGKNDTTILSSWLPVKELMQSHLAADLVTLSTCQLSPGSPNERGGAIALPQSFLAAGAKSVMFSLWTINSITTSQFMAKFYWELKYKRQTNAMALQEAKVASLKETFNFNGSTISRAHPYFWATFMLIGNPKMRPPSSARIPPWGVIVIVYVIVFLISLSITKKTMPGRRQSATGLGAKIR